MYMIFINTYISLFIMVTFQPQVLALIDIQVTAL